ncbi:hypothetical protein ABZP36_024924 [Zizania latifolia]
MAFLYVNPFLRFPERRRESRDGRPAGRVTGGPHLRVLYKPPLPPSSVASLSVSGVSELGFAYLLARQPSVVVDDDDSLSET